MDYSSVEHPIEIAMTTASLPKTVMETILEWSERRPLWQRDAMRRIVSDGTPDETAILEILSLCKKEHGATDSAIEAAPLEAAHLPVIPPGGASVALESLAKVTGVNQLARDQTLSFESAGLTVIYGPNGAGKSGYARILKKACRARRAGDIMPDAFNPPSSGHASATISICKDGVQQTPIAWMDTNERDSLLSAVSVFDKECASIHVQEKNEVAFRPFGLDIPDDLAGVCQKIKEKLTAEETQTEAIRDPVFQKPTWNPATAVGRILSALTADTNLDTLETLGQISQEERARHSQLVEDLNKNPVKAAGEQRLLADNLKRLIGNLERVDLDFSDAAINRLKTLADTARLKREVATVAADKVFGKLSVAGVGSAAWKELWEAARSYSEHVAYPGKTFPPEHEASCVLCHQPLSQDAKARFVSFETFIRENSETEAVNAETVAADALKVFREKRVDIRLNGQTRRHIALQKPALARAIIRFLASGNLRRLQAIRSIGKADPLILHAFATSPKGDLEAFERDIRAYRHEAVTIYGQLRATWERALEDIVFAGVLHRHRDYIDTKHLMKVTVLQETDVSVFRSAFKKCSDLIDAHDPARARDGEVPPPDEILADLKTLNDWAASLRDRQKTVS